MPPKRQVPQRNAKVSPWKTGAPATKRKGKAKKRKQKLPKFPKKRPNAMFYVTLGCMIYRYILDPFSGWYYGMTKISIPESIALKKNGTLDPSSSTNSSLSSSNVVFYHLHDAKTAGSSLNRYMARTYHTVCGHKGYSIDQPFQISKELRMDEGGFGPDRVNWDKMKEMGYHNCKFISNEVDFGQTVSIIQYLQHKGFKVHLLIPCREPITHRLSICVYLGIPLQHWSEKQLDDDEFCSNIIHRCIVDENRYIPELDTIADMTTYYYYKNFSRIDELVQGIVPKRSIVLPNANRTYETGSHYNKDIVKDVKTRCGERINRHYINSHSISTQCNKHLGSHIMNRIPP